MLGADVSGLKQGLKSAQKDVKYFGRNVTGSLKEIKTSFAQLGCCNHSGFDFKIWNSGCDEI